MKIKSLRLASFMYSAVSFLIRMSAWCIMFSLQICLSTTLEVWSTSSNTGLDGADRALVISSMVWIIELPVLIIYIFKNNFVHCTYIWPQHTQIQKFFPGGVWGIFEFQGIFSVIFLCKFKKGPPPLPPPICACPINIRYRYCKA